MKSSPKMSYSDLLRENKELRRRLADTELKLRETESLLEEALNKIAYLEEQIQELQRHIFGRRSEKIPPKKEDSALPSDQEQGLQGDSESPPAEGTSAGEEGEKPKKRKKRQATGADKMVLPESLPIETLYFDIDEKAKFCPETGVALVKIGEEVSEKLAKKPAHYYRLRIIRFKYAHPQRSENGITIEPMPEALLPKCGVDESFLADICVKKYADHLPLYRIAEIMGREGLHISRQQLSKLVLASGKALRPLYELMDRKAMAGDIGHIDESPVRVLDREKKGGTHQGYMWLWVGGRGGEAPYCVYHFKMSREHIHAEELLKGYKGYVHSDKYEAYEKLAAAEKIIWCPCWAHIRRNFFEAQSGPEIKEWFLSEIQKLFLLEKEAWEMAAELRTAFRQEQELPLLNGIIDKVKQLAEEKKGLPKSKIRQAVLYLQDLIPYLKNYLKHPYARLDNNPVERKMRPLAIGRKNWLFIGSEGGGEAAEVIMSLVQTCRLIGVNPAEYLEDVMRRINGHPHKRLEELLPDEWAKQRQIMRQNQ